MLPLMVINGVVFVVDASYEYSFDHISFRDFRIAYKETDVPAIVP